MIKSKNQSKLFMKAKSLLLLGSLALGMIACSDDEPTPDQTANKSQVNLNFNTVQTSTQVNARTLANTLTFTSGFITIREIQFEAETDTDSVEVNLEQEVKIDFATGSTTPDISGLAFQPGTYREIEVEIELQDNGDQPAIVLDGTFTDADGQAHPIRFEFNSGETFEVEKEGLFTFAEKESVVAQVTFNPNAWFAGVSAEQLSLASKNAEGVIVISSTENTNIFDTVADGLDLATEVEMVE